MREIKFRAWDNNIKKMLYYIPFYADEAFNILEFANYLNYDFMQFTGLQDKNSKEIYEGDILAKDNIDGEVSYYVVNFGENEGRYQWYMEGYNSFVEDFERCEIVGNIYECPELLK